MVHIQIGSLGWGSFAIVQAKFAKTQKELVVTLEWDNPRARLRLCGTVWPGRKLRRGYREPYISDKNWRRFGSRNFPRLGREVKQRNGKKIEVKLKNVKYLCLLVKNSLFSRDVANIQLRITKMTDNPAKVNYVFPIGKPKKISGSHHFVRFPVTPVRWYSKFPPRTKGKEYVKAEEKSWQWNFEDETKRHWSFARVKFYLP